MKMGNAPAYRRIYEDLAARIRSGEFAPTSRLLGEAILAERYGVARMTVRQAIGRLVEENLVIRHQGLGTFVTSDVTSRRSLNRLTSFTEDMRGSGQDIATEVLAQKVVAPALEVSRELALSQGAQVVHIGRLRKIAGVPTSVHHSYLPYGEFPSLDREPLVEGSLYRTLEQVYDVRPRRADQRIKAAAAPEELARLLGVGIGSPVLQTERITMDERNVRIEFARSWARPELELTVHLER
jgi:GntR family transcriptional regulator